MNTSGARKWWALAALTIAGLALSLDGTVLNLALPTLATALHASTAELQWFVAGYTLVMAALLLPAGLLGDRYGRKKLLLVALVLFGAASLFCAYATTPSVLIAARAVLGLGAAFLMPLSLSVLPVLFSEAERPRAVAVLLGASFVAYPIGPLLGGWMLTHFWWGSVFLMNVPVVALALIAVWALLPESRSPERPALDPLGVLTSSAALVGLIYGVIKAGQDGWGDTLALAALGAGAVLLLAFVLWERQVGRRQGGQPLVDFALFRSASFTWGTILGMVVSFAFIGLLFTVPQYVQAVVGTDAMGAGVRLLPLIGGLVAGVVLAGRLTRRGGAKVTVAIGFATMAAGLIAGAATRMQSGDGFMAAWVAAAGVGLGLALPSVMDAALGALPVERSGVGSALIQAVRQVGGTFGVALLGAVLNSGYRGRVDLAGLPAQVADKVQKSVGAGVAVAHQLHSEALLHSVRAAFVYGMDVMLGVCAGIAVLGVVLTLAFLPQHPAAFEGENTKRAEGA